MHFVRPSRPLSPGSQGWFPAGYYLRLSRQALGIAAMEQCAKHPNSLCPAAPGPDHTIKWATTTEGIDGADERLFAYLPQIWDIGALPDSVGRSRSPTPLPPSAPSHSHAPSRAISSHLTPSRATSRHRMPLLCLSDHIPAPIRTLHNILLHVSGVFSLPCSPARKPMCISSRTQRSSASMISC